jgi:glutamate-1-semialdehyde 2,1-aminomutase
LQTIFHEELISWGVLIPWISVTSAHGDVELEQTFAAIEKGMRQVKRALADGPIDNWLGCPPAKPVFRPFNRCLKSQCGRLDPAAGKLECCYQGEGA